MNHTKTSKRTHMVRKSVAAMMTVVLTAVLATGCKKSPASPIVQDKDMDQMIEQAEATEAVTTEIAELQEGYDTYQWDVDDTNLYVKVHADAKVEIPNTSQLSVLRVKQHPFDQSFLDRAREYLIKDKPLYEGYALQYDTKPILEQKIQELKQSMENFKQDTSLTDEEKQGYLDENQAQIDAWQEQYEAASESVDITAYPSDNQLHNAAEFLSVDPENSYLKYQSELNPGDFFYAVTDGADGKYQSLSIQNNPNYGYSFQYACYPNGYARSGYVFGLSNSTWPVGADGPVNKMYDTSGNVFPYEKLVSTGEAAPQMSAEEAIKLGDDTLSALQIENFSCYSAELVREQLTYEDNVIPYSTENGEYGYYRDLYKLIYYRMEDGTYAINAGEGKLTDGWQGDEYVKKLWAGEEIEILLNDEGVQEIKYSDALAVTETVVENANLKSFADVKDIFEDMVVVNYAQQEAETQQYIEVERVLLRYTRISAQDDFESGLLVPAWEFIGTISNAYSEDQTDTLILSINAIDGSVINPELGY